jgi:glucosamine kinase
VQRADRRADLFLGVDGGGTRCRARLADRSRHILGEGAAGPANIRLGLDTAFASVIDAARQCFAEAGIGEQALARISACLALAGATEPRDLAATRRPPASAPMADRMGVSLSSVPAASVGR